MKDLISKLLRELGEDPKRDGLRETPERVSELLKELTQGYQLDPKEIVGDSIFSVEYDSMVVVKEIEYYSLCEHHLVPFFGHVHVGYIPAGKVIGAGTIPRVVDLFAKRLQIQERLTEEIATFLEEVIKPLGVGVVIEGLHLCMAMRGAGTRDARMVTSAMKGIFRKDARTRAEFLQLIGSRDAV
ncbi:GTP cyclohydrolase I FolE [Candidatus Acetothermia bacterium]|nr:GTP cyclohydrolase I FolE [Candidatus Acetothermia bacterium]MBI3642774.1 GTP cyclohydrolase I FolE [Candidatus Acetothermia bacterium]